MFKTGLLHILEAYRRPDRRFFFDSNNGIEISYTYKKNNMRAIWSGAIGFGLVNIPVKLYSAVKESQS